MSNHTFAAALVALLSITLNLYTDTAIIEFGLSGSLEILELHPAPGLVNTGTVSSPILVPESGECWGDQHAYSQVLAEVVVKDASGEGGYLCFALSEENNRVCFLTCDSGEWWSPPLNSYSTASEQNCGYSWQYPWLDSEGCQRVVPTLTVSWGDVKARYD